MPTQPKPTALKLVQGNPGKRPLNLDEPKPQMVDSMDPPEWLDDDARKKWLDVCPKLIRMGVLTEVDGDALAGYCIAWSRMKLAEKDIDEYGLTLENKTGSMVKNPAATAYDEATKQLRAFGDLLGMSPAARTRLHANIKPKDRQAEAAERLIKKG